MSTTADERVAGLVETVATALRRAAILRTETVHLNAPDVRAIQVALSGPPTTEAALTDLTVRLNGEGSPLSKEAARTVQSLQQRNAELEEAALPSFEIGSRVRPRGAAIEGEIIEFNEPCTGALVRWDNGDEIHKALRNLEVIAPDWKARAEASEAGWLKASDLHRIAVERAETTEQRNADAERRAQMNYDDATQLAGRLEASEQRCAGLEAVADRQYVAGAQAGFRLGLENDSAGLAEIDESRREALTLLRARAALKHQPAPQEDGT